jgi:hypothetical protein
MSAAFKSSGTGMLWIDMAKHRIRDGIQFTFADGAYALESKAGEEDESYSWE